ncbi:MmpS family transport accessory protein [Mycobacterium paragordonae]|uniref:MmpS family transport accessory protein n=1 Tax=Mycobacterium paragordonae TaxID=1389713 RepID=A0AAJ1W7E0_9MYCO|nr:MmpS family transport accessory protein [Mycobacterium paragordonae]MDP7739596.1 MmpS family transport accessory protein [Mycobacterium paragordonae]
MFRLLARTWVPLIVVTAVVLGGVAVYQLRGVFGSDEIFSATGATAGPLQPSHVKRVIYEVYGPGGSAGSVSYLDQDARPQQASFSSLPWSLTITTTVPAVIANVVAQGSGGEIGCRIRVDSVVKNERSSTGYHAQTSCLVKAA